MSVRKTYRRLPALIVTLAMLVGAATPFEPAVAVDTIDWLDHSFGGGLQAFDLSTGSDPARAVAVQADGKVVVAASVNEQSSPNAIAVLRFLPDGRLDGEFGTNGKVLLAGQGTPTIGMAIQDDGRIVVGVNLGYGFRVVRLDATGGVDTTFNAGHVTFGLPGAAAVEYNALALAPGGKVVVAGSFITAAHH